MKYLFFLMYPVYVSSIVFHARNSCPADVVEWNQWKHRLNCSKTEFYHCLLDERNSPGEFCTNERPSRVPPGSCPRYNNYSGQITTEHCDVQNGCPTVSFDSNEVYKYQACLNINEEKPTAGGASTPTNNTGGVDSSVVIGISVAVVVVAIVLVIALVCRTCRRRKQRRRREKEVPLLVRSDVPFYKTSAFHEAVTFLHNGGKFLCFNGRWGSGKTTTAKQVYWSVTGRNPVVIQNLAEFDVSSCDDCVIIEEPFSKQLSNVEVENIMSKIKIQCSKIRETPGKFAILTFSDDEWVQISDGIKRILMELDIGPLQDFSLNYESLSLGDRNQILHSIFSHYNPTKPFRKVEKVVTCNELYLGYAETCTLLSRCSNFQANPGPIVFVNRPLSYLKSYLERMCTSSDELERSKFVMLLSMSLNERKIDLNKSNTRLRELFVACGLSPEKIQLTSIIPEEFVLTEEEEVYVLQHDVIQRMVLVVFGTHHFEKLVRFSPWNSVPDWVKETTILYRISKKIKDPTNEIQPILEISHEQWTELRNKCESSQETENVNSVPF